MLNLLLIFTFLPPIITQSLGFLSPFPFEAAFQGQCVNSSTICSHYCVDLPEGTFECTCPTGLVLSLDGYTCVKEVLNESTTHSPLLPFPTHIESLPTNYSIPISLPTSSTPLALPVLHNAYIADTISFYFKPRAPTGLLLLTGEREDAIGDILGIKLKNWKIVFWFDCGSGPGEVESGEIVRPNEWNKLVVVRRRWDGWIQLNSGSVQKGRSEGLFSRITFRQPVYIGSSGNISLPSPVPLFQGCIRDLVINNKQYFLENEGKFLPCTNQSDSNFNPCDNINCYHGGECTAITTPIETIKSPVCNCPLGYDGEFCENKQDLELPSFNTSSYLRYNPLPSILTPTTSHLLYLDLVVVFKPESHDGILLYNGQNEEENDGDEDSESNDYFSIYLDQGHVICQMDLGTGVGEVRSPAPLTLSSWHMLRITRTARLLTLKLDNQSEVRILTPGPFTQLSLNGDLFLGGVPHTKQVSPKLRVGKLGFSGCIQQVTLNSAALHILGSALSGSNLQNCPHSCFNHPCPRGESCIPDLDNYKCSGSSPILQSDFPQMINSGVKFSGDGSWLGIEIDPTTTHHQSTPQLMLSLVFKPDSQNGLLLQSNGLNPDNLFSLDLQDGEVEFSWRMGGSGGMLRAGAKVKVGQWNILEVVRNENWSQLKLNNDSRLESESNGKLRYLDFTGFYLGGSPKSTLNFIGCVKTLKFNSKSPSTLWKYTGRNLHFC